MRTRSRVEPRRCRSPTARPTSSRRRRRSTGSTTTTRFPRSPACSIPADDWRSCGTRATTATRGWRASRRSSGTSRSRSPTSFRSSTRAGCSAGSRPRASSFEQVLDRDGLLDLVLSRSYLAKLPPVDREPVLDAVGALFDETARGRRRAARLRHGVLPGRAGGLTRLTATELYRARRRRSRGLSGKVTSSSVRASG